MDDLETHTVTILLLGDSGVGKSTFLSRISRGSQGLAGPANIELLRDLDQPFIIEVTTRKGKYRLEWYDTSSPECWKLLKPNLIIICYDISQRMSLINLQRLWIKEVKINFDRIDVLPIAILGLKRDLRSEDDPNGIIYPQEALRISQEMRTDRYVECSAVSGDLLELAFKDLCEMAVRATDAGGAQTPGGCAIM